VSETDDLEHTEHPDSTQYIAIGIILAAFTALEVAISFAAVPGRLAIPSLITLTVLKFVLVVLWFMHLRFDSGWFRRLFAFGLILALAVYAATISLMLYAGASAPAAQQARIPSERSAPTIAEPPARVSAHLPRPA
jgi:cytochrome c oxidase subunit 4